MTDQALPPGTELSLKRQQWNQYAATLRDRKRLTRPEWESFLDLTRELSESDKSADWFAQAEAAGAFGENQVPKATPSEMKVRSEQVADWLEDGRPLSWQRLQARKKWGIGEDALQRLHKRAEVILQKRADHAQAISRGLAAKRIDELYRMGADTGNPQAISASIEHLRKVAGLDKPAVQEMRFANPDGSPLAAFEVPEKEKV